MNWRRRTTQLHPTLAVGLGVIAGLAVVAALLAVFLTADPIPDWVLGASWLVWGVVIILTRQQNATVGISPRARMIVGVGIMGFGIAQIIRSVV